MKHGRRLTLQDKRFLAKQGFNPKYFLRLSKNAEGYEFLEVTSGKILSLRR